ncbi:hypothetical protein MNB_SM-3-1001 [hydrothermal vent metagenome]|uniref:Uncharacterized protein n=1 Tax=hydrothermal vent metagenome TaxID=652676 RepID=A0A1W1D596_9ZZZZ
MKMSIRISRQNVYLLALTIFLLLFVFVFSFVVLIPQGKEYRKQRMELKKEDKELYEYKKFYDETFHTLKNLQSKNKHIIMAFENDFKASRFEQEHKKYFVTLKLFKIVQQQNAKEYELYEVNATSKIDSPKSFYQFLDAINKSDWIISVNFPITFQREKDLIRSSFTMKVYKLKQ